MVSDLLIQSRSTPRNLLAVEMKRKGYYKNIDSDRERLTSLVRPYSSDLQFACVHDTLLGVFIVFGQDGVDMEIFSYSPVVSDVENSKMYLALP